MTLITGLKPLCPESNRLSFPRRRRAGWFRAILASPKHWLPRDITILPRASEWLILRVLLTVLYARSSADLAKPVFGLPTVFTTPPSKIWSCFMRRETLPTVSIGRAFSRRCSQSLFETATTGDPRGSAFHSYCPSPEILGTRPWIIPCFCRYRVL